MVDTFLITYELNGPRDSYSGLDAEIRAIDPSYWHCLRSTWMLNSSLTVSQIRNRLASHIHSGDALLVIRVHRPAAWAGLSEVSGKWIRTRVAG